MNSPQAESEVCHCCERPLGPTETGCLDRGVMLCRDCHEANRPFAMLRRWHSARRRVKPAPGVRPWVRFWARSLDMFIFQFVIGVLAGLFMCVFPYIGPLHWRGKIIVLVVLVALMALLEATLLATWGSTPGKALLRVTVRNSNGKRLDFGIALKRFLRVLMFGYGLGVPFLNIATLLYSYDSLRVQGKTHWDDVGDCVVSHAKIGAGRIIVTILCFTLLAWQLL